MANIKLGKKGPFLSGLALGVMTLALGLLVQPVTAAPSCDADGDSFFKATRKCGGNDCDDSNPAIFPGATEICNNGIDDNCSGTIDEGCGGGDPLICLGGTAIGTQCFSDADCGGICIGGDVPGDACSSDSDCPPNNGRGNLRGKCQLYVCGTDTGVQCTDNDGDGFNTEGGECGPVDCDDGDPAINPDASEVCGDGIDNNCDSQTDDACPVTLPGNLSAAGDSITQAFAANCSCNTNFICLLCLLGGDQPENSWFDGSSSSVFSMHDRYLSIDGAIGANKSAAQDGSEMRGSSNNFFEQAMAIMAQAPLPDRVEVALGGNDLCNRECIDPARCANPVYDDAQWRASVRQGLDVLVGGLPTGATIRLLGVPRVQDLYQAGLDKQQQSSSVDCQNVWLDYDICTIATQVGVSASGEDLASRLAGIAERQKRYNEILREEAQAYNANSAGQNPRLIEVLTDYVDETTDSIGTFQFSAADIDGGDCFHPSLQGQSTIAEKASQSNADLTSQ
jgi:hypothetical protein